MKDYQLHTLPNGIRIVHKQVNNTKVAHCGLMLNIGSRNEPKHLQGIAHFWEHMAFKGTKKRKAFHIISKLDAVGGELNAYTTKEKIAFFASVLDKHLEKAIDLLSDITFDSIFPHKQIEKERKVILEEMAMYKDSPEDSIHDEFDELVFGDHPMGRNILGKKETISQFHKEDFVNFIDDNLDTEEIVFTSVANISMKKIIKFVEKHLSDIPFCKPNSQKEALGVYHPNTIHKKRPITQALCTIGIPAYEITNPLRLPLFLLTNLLGGPAMNSKLNLSLREKYAYVYAVEASYSSYSDTGLFYVHFGTKPNQLEKSINVINREFNSLKNNSLGAIQLKAAKEQIKGQIAIADENNASMMLAMAKSMLNKGKIDSIEYIFEQIDAITASDLLQVANEILDNSKLSQLTYLPAENGLDR